MAIQWRAFERAFKT